MPKHRQDLFSGETQLDLMLTNQEYIVYAEALLKNVIFTLETYGRLMTINGANIFSAENGLPINVSYPPIEVAKRIAVDGKKYLEGAARFSSVSYMSKYHFDLEPVNSIEVVTKSDSQHIKTGKVLLDVGWS